VDNAKAVVLLGIANFAAALAVFESIGHNLTEEV
jgi:hypothetical protein